MTRFRIIHRGDRDAFAVAVAEIKQLSAEAATGSMRQAGGMIKTEGRQAIGAAGFSKDWQQAFRVKTYPAGLQSSLGPAAYAYHKIPYAGVFEEGADIEGKPDLFLPIEGMPDRIGGRKITPELFEQRIGDLTYVQRPGRAPVLVAPAALTRNQVGLSRPQISLADLRRGTRRAGSRTIRSVPVFVGVPRVRIRQKFSIAGVVAGVADRLGELYARQIARLNN